MSIRMKLSKYLRSFSCSSPPILYVMYLTLTTLTGKTVSQIFCCLAKTRGEKTLYRPTQARLSMFTFFLSSRRAVKFRANHASKRAKGIFCSFRFSNDVCSSEDGKKNVQKYETVNCVWCPKTLILSFHFP